MRQHKQSVHQSKTWLGRGLVFFILLGFSLTPAAAFASSSTKSSPSTATSSTNISSAVTQSYNAGPAVQTGMIVELDTKNPQTVIPLNTGDAKHMLGIVVPTNNAAIILTPSNVSQQQVLVATTGHYDVLVSNQQGAIKTGDYITISSLDGIGMEAGADQSEVLGRADGNFNGVNNVLGSAKLKTQTGQQTTVNIGTIPIDIGITQNPLAYRSPIFVPIFLSKLATGVSDKPVSNIRIYTSMVMLAITAIIAVSILYGSVRGGMIALGRNPLSKQQILRGLLESMLLVLIIFTAGVFAVYLLLKL